jgi:hypothetical protein
MREVDWSAALCCCFKAVHCMFLPLAALCCCSSIVRHDSPAPSGMQYGGAVESTGTCTVCNIAKSNLESDC